MMDIYDRLTAKAIKPKNFRGESIQVDIEEIFKTSHNWSSGYWKSKFEKSPWSVQEVIWDEVIHWDISTHVEKHYTVTEEQRLAMMEAAIVADMPDHLKVYAERAIQRRKDGVSTPVEDDMWQEIDDNIGTAITDAGTSVMTDTIFNQVLEAVEDFVTELGADGFEFIKTGLMGGCTTCNVYEFNSLRLYYHKKTLLAMPGLRRIKCPVNGWYIGDEDDTEWCDDWFSDMAEDCLQTFDTETGYNSVPVEEVIDRFHDLGALYELKVYCEKQHEFAEQCKRLGF